MARARLMGMHQGRAIAARRRLAAMFVGISLLSGIAGWMGGSQLVSSDELAARRQPPGLSTITATVEQRALHSEAITRGTLTRDTEYPLSVPASSEASVGAIVTQAPPQVGTSLAEGQLVAEVGGRPVLALEGDLPAFRDLRLGDEGPDVDQLRAALARLDLLSDGGSGSFDSIVAAAVAELYASADYPAPDAGDDAQDALLRARADQRAAQAELDELLAGQRAVPAAERLQAEARIAAAENELAIVDAETAAAVAEAARGYSIAQQETSQARSALDIAQDRLDQAEDGQHPDTGQPPTQAELEVLRDEVAAAEDAYTHADGLELERKHTWESAQLRRTAQLDAANADLQLARTELAELGKLPPPTPAQLESAQLELHFADKALLEARRAAATYLSRSEVVFVPKLPATVSKVMASRGDSLEGPLALVSGTALHISASLPATTATKVSVGDIAIIDDLGTGTEFTAVLVAMAAEPVTDGQHAGRVPITLVPQGQTPDHTIGLSLRIRLPIESTEENALVIPVTALGTAADGSVFVERTNGADTERVPVHIELSASGLAAVTPVPGHDLTAGDQVIVGIVS